MAIQRSFTRMVMATAAAALCTGAGMVAAPVAHAQDSLSVAARLVMRQPVGTVLRLSASNRDLTGVLERVDSGTVYLADPPNAVRLSTVSDAWLQRRSTGRGGKIGAAIGAPTGAALFGLGAVFLSALCEYDCDISGGDVVVVTIGGAAAGAVSGYIVGALIGASVPRWERLTESSAPPSIVADDPRRHAGLSAFSISPGVARAAGGDHDVGGGVAISYLSQLSRHIALGGEGARYSITTEQYTYDVPCDTDPEVLCTHTITGNGVWSVGGLGRFGTGAERTFEPFLLLGLGVTNFGEVTLGGYSAGAGARYRIGGGRFALSGDARWHSNFTNSGDDSQLGFTTVGIGVSLLR